MTIRTAPAAVLIAALALSLLAGCRSATDDDRGAERPDQEVGSVPSVEEGAPAADVSGSAADVPESSARIVASLPESSVVVIDPSAGSRADRIEELAESVGATVEGDVARIVVEESVLFEFGSAELLASAADVLDDIAELLTELEADRIDVVGHTDAIGTDAFNLDLSTRRARAVEDALVERGVSGDMVEARGEGEADPVAPNENADGTDNPDGRARNRRVEITASGIADDDG